MWMGGFGWVNVKADEVNVVVLHSTSAKTKKLAELANGDGAKDFGDESFDKEEGLASFDLGDNGAENGFGEGHQNHLPFLSVLKTHQQVHAPTVVKKEMIEIAPSLATIINQSGMSIVISLPPTKVRI